MADSQPMPNPATTNSNDSNPPLSTETTGDEAPVRRPSNTPGAIGGQVEGGAESSTKEENSPKAKEDLPPNKEVLTPCQETMEEKKINESPPPTTKPIRMTLFQIALAKVKEEEEIANASKVKEEEASSKATIPTLPPTSEKRAAPYVARPDPKILYKIERELKDNRYYLMGKRVFGDSKSPESCSFFVVADIGKRYQVKLRMFPSCQCGDFLEDRLCTHIMFIMLKFFKLKKYDPLNWQRALLSTELRTLLSDPRITSSSKVETKKKFVSKLFPPKVAPPANIDDGQALSSTVSEKRIGPQFCPICLEQFNFIADTPEKPYIGPIPWEPKFMPKLDMGPPKCIQDDKDEKARLEQAMKKHEEGMAANQGELVTDTSVPKEEVKGEENLENKTKQSEEKSTPETESQESGLQNSDNITTLATKEDEKTEVELDLLQPLRKYEPLWFCPNPDCKGDNVCFKIVHEWCYKKFDNFGIYPRGKQCPTYGLM